MIKIRGKFNTELKEGDYFKYDSMDWRIYKVVDNSTFTAWEDSGEIGELRTFSITVGTCEIYESSVV